MDGEQAPRWRVGDRMQIKGVTITVSELDIAWLPRIRDHLIEYARRGQTTTYADLKRDLGLPHAINGLGRLLDLVGEDCARRAEPSLAALVVSRSTGEVGADFDGDAQDLRERVYRHWRSSDATDRAVTAAHIFTLNGTRRSLDQETVRTRLIRAGKPPASAFLCDRRTSPDARARIGLALIRKGTQRGAVVTRRRKRHRCKSGAHSASRAQSLAKDRTYAQGHELVSDDAPR